MRKALGLVLHATVVVSVLTLAACSSSDNDAEAAPKADAGALGPDGSTTQVPGPEAGAAPDAGGDAAAPSGNAGTSDLPAVGSDAEVRAWLATGNYKAGSWKCEAAPHAARSPSPHGVNRICSNATLSAHGAGEFPVGAAGVKELYDQGGTKVVGHAVYRKVKAGAGDAWYWWEDMNGSTVANGMGDQGAVKTICVGCHAGAGSDADHSGHDLVYTQVK